MFEAGLRAVWDPTQTTLGEVTLNAIADRVLHNAAERFPSFSALQVEPSGGIQFRALREGIGSIQAAELRAGVRFVLVEFLTVLGSLTAEILTAELHAALSKVDLPEPDHS
ncbi:MAG: hypothetical protein NVS2B9_04670 [Myxococcales bacterium]